MVLAMPVPPSLSLLTWLTGLTHPTLPEEPHKLKVKDDLQNRNPKEFCIFFLTKFPDFLVYRGNPFVVDIAKRERLPFL